MAIVKEIGIFSEKRAPKRLLEEAVFVENGGIEGDFHAKDGERAVSMMGIETTKKMRDEGIEGLCTSKFQTNLTTEGIDLKSLAAGDILSFGGVELQIAQVGKECFAECRMEDRSKCPLKAECAFGMAVKSGAAKPGDKIEIKKGNLI